MKTIYKLTFFFALAVLVTACQKDVVNSGDTVNLGESFDLSIGKSALLPGGVSRLIFAQVLDDSRCPELLDCDGLGNARVKMILCNADNSKEDIELIDGRKQAFQLDGLPGFELNLIKLLPLPSFNRPIRPEDYILRLVLRKSNQP